MIIDKPTPSQLPALRALWKQAFGDPDDFLDCFYRVAFSPERCRCVIKGGSLAAVLYWFDCGWEGKRLAYLYAVATDTAFRGQGLCRELFANTHDHLRALGYHGCILVPNTPGLFSLYGKFGYRACSYVREFTCAAAGPATPLNAIDKDRYAALRRQYLPENSVLQEGEALSLLDTQASFYAGDSVLLVAAPYEGKLVVSELLGDPETAPGILTALGYSEGKFRVPGSQKPFTMYYSLTKETAMPGYFGLALD